MPSDLISAGAGFAPVISCRGVEKAYGRGASVLRGVDLAVAEGARVALIGANGSGKSTLLRAIIGLHPITGGAVETLGESFTSEPNVAQRTRLRRQTGFVFQNHCLVRRASVLTNVVHGLLGGPGSWRAFTHITAPASWRDRAMEALAEVGLAHKALERADQLSGGQQQRVAIARALVRRPRLLIADEPAASLDPAAGEEIMSLFTLLARTHGITLLFTSHDMTHARSFSERVVALKGGRIVLDKAPGAIADTELDVIFGAEHV